MPIFQILTVHKILRASSLLPSEYIPLQQIFKHLIFFSIIKNRIIIFSRFLAANDFHTLVQLLNINYLHVQLHVHFLVTHQCTNVTSVSIFPLTKLSSLDMSSLMSILFLSNKQHLPHPSPQIIQSILLYIFFHRLNL
jgi:hypothetical protein